MFKRYQAALETIILIGGVVILSAASYFLMKGFLGSSGGSTHETMGRATDASRQDLLNLGLEPVILPSMRWYSVASSIKTGFDLENTGSGPLSANVSLKKASFSDNGVNLGQFEIGFISLVSGEYAVLGFTDNSTHFEFTSPLIPAGETLGIVLHYNNSSPYTLVTGFDYIVYPGEVVVDSVASEVKSDFEAPSVGEVSVETPEAGVGETITFSVPVDESSFLSKASFVVTSVSGSQTMSTSVISVDSLYRVFTGFSGGSLQVMGKLADGDLVFELVVPASGEYNFSLELVDEWGNVGTGVVVLNVSEEGSGLGGGPSLVMLRSVYGSGDIFVRNTTGGSSWSSPQLVWDNAYNPSLIQDSDDTYWLAFDTSGDVLLTNSTDGLSFGSTVTVATGGFGRPSLIQDSSGDFWMAFRESSSGDIFVESSADGETWVSKGVLSSGANSYYNPSLIQDVSGKYWVSYVEFGAGDLFVESSLDGIAWGSKTLVETTICRSGSSALIQDSGGGYKIAYVRPPGCSQHTVALSGSEDGSSWSPILTTTFSTSGYPALVQDSAGTYWLASTGAIPGGTFQVSNSTDCMVWTSPVSMSGEGYELSIIEEKVS